MLFGIDDRKDKNIRDRQGFAMLDYLSKNIPGYPIAKWNYPTCVIWDTFEEPNYVAYRLNKHKTLTRAYATDKVGELQFSGRVLVIEWEPYKWEDENGNMHLCGSLQAIEKAAEKCDVFSVYTIDGEYIGNYFQDYCCFEEDAE